MSNEDPSLLELKKILKVLTIAHSESLERELSKIATSDERKRIWVLIDGVRTTEDIAATVGVTVRSVNRFLKLVATAGLVDNPWGKPAKRLLDYVPPSWIELVKLPEEGTTEGAV